MIEQDGFKTTYDSHNQTSSEPTELDKFKEEAEQVTNLLKNMFYRIKTPEFQRCLAGKADEKDFDWLTDDTFHLYNRIRILNYNVAWLEGGKK